MTRGKLLSLSEKHEDDYEVDGRVRRLAENLVLLSANPDHLACACAQLAALDPSAVLSPAPSRTRTRIVKDSLPADHDRPAQLLERHSEHRRAETLAALATHPNTPHTAVTSALNMLHPAELAWIAERIEGPGWFLEAAAAVPAPPVRGRRGTAAPERRRTQPAPRPRRRPAVLA